MSWFISTQPADDPLGLVVPVAMEFKFKRCREGGPVGFNFQPKEEELIEFYLLNKVAGDDSIVIPECDLYGTKNPWEIWQEFHDSNCKAFSRDNELYLFTSLKKKGRSHSRIDRRVGLGTWAGEDSAKPVFSVTPKEKRVVGSKKRYRFEKTGSQHHGRWIMIEYSLDESLLRQIPNPNQFVVCKIKKNERVAAGQRRQSLMGETGKRSKSELKDADAATQKQVKVVQIGDGNENQEDIFNHIMYLLDDETQVDNINQVPELLYEDESEKNEWKDADVHVDAEVVTVTDKQAKLEDHDHGQRNKNFEMVDLFSGKFPELVIGNGELVAFWNNNFPTLDHAEALTVIHKQVHTDIQGNNNLVMN